MGLMIKENKVEIKITSRNKKYFLEKGYDVKCNNFYKVNINDLSKNSKQKITAICDICNKEYIITYHKYITNYNRYNFYSCKKCSNIKREMTSIKNWGVNNYKKTEECNEKIKKTNLEKYGVEYHLSSKYIRNKIKKTNLEKYGVEHFSKTEQFYEKTYNRWKKEILLKLNKYNIIDFKLKNDRTIDIKCDYGKEHYFNINSKNLYQRKEIQNTILCTICNKIDNKISSQEIILKDFVKNNISYDVFNNVFNIIPSFELDIYIPELKLSFEFNGIWWHNELYKDKNYHLNKTELCEKNGIQLIHIYEDDWLYKQDIVKSMILNKLGKTPNKIYAKKCEIREITDNKLVREFLDKNHIQGYIRSSIKIGLFYEDELVSLMIFIKRKNNYELLRFCNKLNTNVVEGGNILFKYFIKKFNPKMIITYVDRSWSNGNLYKQLGFEYKGKTDPNYYYYDLKMNKYNRLNFKKIISDNKSKYYRVYNSGNIILKYEQKS